MGARFNFLAKHTLFQIPVLGTWLKYVGGMPIIRSGPQGYVQDLIYTMGQRPYFWLAIAPEGTRGKTPGWRSGFYHLAIGARVPVGMAYLDYKRKEVGLTEFFYPTGDEEKDLITFRDFYASKSGFKSDLAAPIVFWTPPKG
jgi:1-acyl-sn-glycerol-3-phosphate acyltransferase